jgi:Rieske Fe-S protein
VADRGTKIHEFLFFADQASDRPEVLVSRYERARRTALDPLRRNEPTGTLSADVEGSPHVAQRSKGLPMECAEQPVSADLPLPGACCSRRQFLLGLAVTAAAGSLAGAILAACGGSPTAPSPPRTGTVSINLDDPAYAALGTVGGSVKVAWPNDHPVIVRRISGGGYEALSSTCPHAGCEVGLPANGVISCPCHGSRFDSDGQLLAGPASSNLFPATVTLSGRQLTIAFA